MNIYFLLTLSSSILSPFFYEWISRRTHFAKFFDGLVMATLIGLISLHILPESFQHAGPSTFVALALGLLGPVLISNLLKKNQCEIQRPFLLISVLGFVAHNMLDGAALVVHPQAQKSSHFLALAIVIHRLLENMALWRTLSRNLSYSLSILCIVGLSVAMAVGFFAGEAIFVELDANIFHLLQSLACGLLFHVVLHPHHIKEMLKSPARHSLSAFFGVLLAILAYIFWPAHSHSEDSPNHEHSHK